MPIGHRPACTAVGGWTGGLRGGIAGAFGGLAGGLVGGFIGAYAAVASGEIWKGTEWARLGGGYGLAVGLIGGTIVAVGTPEQIAQVERSYTGQFLGSYLVGVH